MTISHCHPNLISLFLIRENTMKAIRFVVRGIVQGVYFRAFTREKANELDLKGYVKNLDDGSVEVFAQGEVEKIEELADKLKKGPPMSKVTNVQRYEENTLKYDNFKIKY